MATRVRLSSKACEVLKEIARTGNNARMVRRSQALLWLHRGEPIATVARRLGMSRQAIYDLLERYEARAGRPVRERIQDDVHSGRPAKKRVQVAQAIAQLLQKSPMDYGYRGYVWTTPMLRTQVERRLHTSVSLRTVRRALHALRYRYKRPRYVLARRDPHWRQAKGGSCKA